MEAVSDIEICIFVGDLARARQLLAASNTSASYKAIKEVELALKEGQLALAIDTARAYLISLGLITTQSEPSPGTQLTPVARRLAELICVMEKALGRQSSLEGTSTNVELTAIVRHFWPGRPVPVAVHKKEEKNWDRWAQEEEKRETLEKDFDGDPAMHFFRQIYANCDEDGKRAMMKSYIESNGRSLSTNWSTEKSKDYKGKDHIPPPEGVEDHR